MPSRVQEAMQMQVEAERRKRAAILESEGVRTADINVAEGKRQSRILASEAEKQEQINKASGEAAAILAVSEARAKGLQIIASALSHEDGRNAASLNIAEQYVRAFNKLAKTNNTLILPSNVGDVSSLVAQAMTIYKQILPTNQQGNGSPLQSRRKDEINSEADEVFEYYSDKEEAEKQRNITTQPSKLL